MTDETYDLGSALKEGLKKALAWKRGEIALEVRKVDAMPPARIQAIRKQVARSAAAFEKRFGIPAATIRNWEQGRRTPDPAARLLLSVIERHPEMVEQTARSTPAA